MIILGRLHFVTLSVAAQLMAAIVPSACTKNHRFAPDATEPKNSSPSAHKSVIRNSVPEWYAFAVFHPESALTEDSFSQNTRQSSIGTIGEAAHEEPEIRSEVSHMVLGARSLIPILRAAFGNQARGNDVSEENSWFTTHPSDLFTPSELASLCYSPQVTEPESPDEFCWKPQVTPQYLVSLANFSADACSKLVESESKRDELHTNKIYRSRVFAADNLKHFSIRHLRMDKDDVNDEWLNKIIADADKFLKEELKLEQPDTDDTIKVYSIEKAIFACRAALNSQEFYSR